VTAVDASTVVHWAASMRWDDDSLFWDGMDERVSSAWVDLGDPDDPHRPLLMFVRYAPGITVKAHYHDTDYSSIVLGGEVTITGKLHRPGSVRSVAAGTTYGPLVAGPEGTLLLDVFEDRNGAFPRWPNPGPDESERHQRLQRYLEGRLRDTTPRPRLRPPA
jgi:hypothetical protein